MPAGKSTGYPAGWPRPRGVYAPRGADAEPRLLPVPWVTRVDTDKGIVGWTDFRSGSLAAHTEQLCQVCGEKLGPVRVLGDASIVLDEPLTNGTAMHPRCAALAVKFCPHFQRGELAEPEAIVAWLYNGEGCGYLERPDMFAGWTQENPEDVFTDSNPVDPQAISLTRRELLEIVARDPLGEHPTSTPATPG